jgi:hypothetical protein
MIKIGVDGLSQGNFETGISLGYDTLSALSQGSIQCSWKNVVQMDDE